MKWLWFDLFWFWLDPALLPALAWINARVLLLIVMLFPFSLGGFSTLAYFWITKSIVQFPGGV